MVLAALAFLWNHDLPFGRWAIPLIVVATGSVGAVLFARLRARLQRASRDLGVAERRLQAILDNLDEAVTVQGADGRNVYANQAAADLLRLSSPQELIDAPPGLVMERFAVTREDGRPVSLRDLPGSRLRAGETAPPMLVRNVVRETGDERWLVNRATAVSDEEGKLAFVVNAIEDVTEAKRAERGQRLLAEAGRVLASSLEVEPMLDAVVWLAIPDWSDWCGVDMPGPDGEIQAVAIAHADPRKLAAGRELRRRYPVPADAPEGLAAVIREGVTWRRDAVPDEAIDAYAVDADHARLMREVGFKSILVVPMRAGPRVLGAITLVSSQAHRFDDVDVAVAEELGRRAGTAVQNAGLFRERAEIASTLQAGLLPAALPPMPRWRTASLYRPVGEANEVGGDFYDAFAVPGGWALIVGDVAGKGPRAAAVTGMARHTLRTAVRLAGRLVHAYAELNAGLLAEPELSLCTVGGVRLADDWAHVVCAGHPLPVLLRDGVARTVGAVGPLLGAYAEVSWPETEIELRPGDVLVLYTDGVLDAVGDDGERFGEDRLLAAIEATRTAPSADAAVEALDRALESFAATGQRDDTAVLAVAWEGVAEIREELARTDAAPAAARRAMTRRLDGSLTSELMDRTLVLTSELVTNAVRHGGPGPVALHATVSTTQVRVEVRDGGDGFTPPAAPNPGPHGGYGLMLVDEAADRWGVEPDGGTCVWFEIDFPGA